MVRVAQADGEALVAGGGGGAKVDVVAAGRQVVAGELLPASKPTAMLSAPLVTSFSALLPMAVLDDQLAESNAPGPMATLLLPVTLLASERVPTAVLKKALGDGL